MNKQTAGHPGPRKGPEESWEYMYHDVRFGTFSTEIHTINAFGAEGWELVTALPLQTGNGVKDPALTSSVLLLFKRRRP